MSKINPTNVLVLILIALFWIFVIILLNNYISRGHKPLISPVVLVSPTPEITPEPTPALKLAMASYYDRSVCGEGECRTANGEIFNDQGHTLAHKSLPFGTTVKFTYKGRSTVCRVNDRGPYIKGREFDLSKGCADDIGLKLGSVNYQIL